MKCWIAKPKVINTMRIAKAKATSFEKRPKGPHIKETKRVHKLLGTYLDMTTLYQL